MGSGEGCGKGGFRNLWYKAGSAISSAEGFQRLASQHISEKYKKNTSRLLGTPPKFTIFLNISFVQLIYFILLN